MARKGQVSTRNAGAKASPDPAPPISPSRPGTTHHQGRGRRPLSKARKGFSARRNFGMVSLLISSAYQSPGDFLTLAVAASLVLFRIAYSSTQSAFDVLEVHRADQPALLTSHQGALYVAVAKCFVNGLKIYVRANGGRAWPHNVLH